VAGFLARRIAALLLVVFAVSLVTFAISHLVPGDPARMIAGPRASAQQLAAIRHELGLDRPVLVQYEIYGTHLLHGDLGKSIVTNRPVLGEIASRVPATLELMLCALIVSLLFGIPIGIAAALNQGRFVDHLVRGFSALTVSIPAFWLAPLLILLFYGALGVFPASGRIDGDPPTAITGLFLIDSALTLNFRAFADAASHLVLPVATLSFLDMGAIARLVRGQMIEVLSEDYIKTARASGLPERAVIYRHALRNALIPLVTVLGMSLAQLLYGSVIIESLFAWPGTGSYVVNAIFALDFPVIMGFTVLVSTAYVVVNLLVDLLYMLLDPRIRAAA